MTSEKQTVHNVTIIYWGKNFMARQKGVSIQVITLLIKIYLNLYYDKKHC